MGCGPSKPGVPTETERLMRGRRGIDKSERRSSRVLVGAAEAANRKNKDLLAAELPKLDAAGRLTAEEVAKRISGTAETQTVTLGTIREGEDERGIIKLRYAALTQRGYYPDNPAKANQDSYRLIPSDFASGVGDAYFAVYDGHGDAGHDCAAFAKSKLPNLIAQAVKKKRAAANAASLKELTKSGGSKPKNAFHPCNWPYLGRKEYEGACRMAHLGCNRAMHDDVEVKDSLSGTTAISVGFHAGRMTVCNVGDSRAVLGYRINKDQNLTMSRSDAGATPAEEKTEIDEESVAKDDDAVTVLKAGSILAIPLSEDQTPYRKDERERLKRAGARICSIDQMEGKAPMHDDWGEVNLGVDIDKEGDPPRVWCQDHNYPGTAFSRSLGDSIGEDLGVNAEPEMFTKEVTRGDEILVIASDGIFEFLTNQQVIDFCAECGDPQYACARLLEKSYSQWLEYELRTDDITVVVLFMENGRENDDELMRGMMKKRNRVKKSKSTAEKEARNSGGGLMHGSMVLPQDAGPAVEEPQAARDDDHLKSDAESPEAAAGKEDGADKGGDDSYAEFERMLSSSDVARGSRSSADDKAAAE